ncbi:MAG: hypothetical protein ABJB66_08555 [Gemmatimonadaceae bacterium]
MSASVPGIVSHFERLSTQADCAQGYANMSSIVFVHGTGVRQPAYDELFKRVSAELESRNSTREVVRCYWGGDFGARLAKGGRSIPDYDTTRALPGVADENDAAATLWELLEKDPLFEFRLLADGSSTTRARIGEESPGEQIADRLTYFKPSPTLAELLQASDLTEQFETARRLIVQSGVVRAALRSAPSELDPYRRVLARSLVAMTIHESELRDSGADGTAAWVLAGPRRDAIVDLIFLELGGGERGLGAWTAKQVTGIASWVSTSLVKRKRGSITDAGSPAAGDILLYQARGEPIRNCIYETLVAAKPPVTVIAHSLGGIAAVELLILKNIPSVELLVTVGSQSPFLYELGALCSLAPDAKLPPHFPRWLNVYDKRDFLSYLAKPVFDDSRITDVEVDNRESFPRAHSAYWSNPALWDAVEQSWASL